MKTRFFLVCVMILVFLPFAKAEWDKDYSDRKLSEAKKCLQTNIDNLKTNTAAQIKNLVESVNALSNRLQKVEDDLTKEINEKHNTLKTLDGKVKGTDRIANIALWISLSLVLVVCGVCCLVLWPRKPKSVPISHRLSDKPTCPRCGWEHDPGDTVCKNPNCKTQF